MFQAHKKQSKELHRQERWKEQDFYILITDDAEITEVLLRSDATDSFVMDDSSADDCFLIVYKYAQEIANGLMHTLANRICLWMFHQDLCGMNSPIM